MRTFLSQSSPSASFGLLISLLGALFLLVGVIMLRRSEERPARVEGVVVLGSREGQHETPSSPGLVLTSGGPRS